MKYNGSWYPECARKRVREAQIARPSKGIQRVVPKDDASGIVDVYVEKNGQTLVM